MWGAENKNQFGGGGGFFNSPGQFGGGEETPGNKAKRTGKRNNRTAPIVISQALKSSDDGIKIWGSEVQVISIIARVCDIKMQSSKVVYNIEDITGRMEAVLWIDQESMENGEDKSLPNIMVNTYVQIFGNVKNNRGQKVIIIYKILNITNVNAITFHYLQCINNRIQMEAKFRSAKSNVGDGSSAARMPVNSMMSNMDIGGSAAGFNPRQVMVYTLIKASSLEEGTSRSDIQSSLKDKMSTTEMDKILEWMCGEGHIYSTIDEDHFRATDA